MKPRDCAIAELRANGFEFLRHGKNHDIYWNPSSSVAIPVKRHDFNENDAKYISKGIKHSSRMR